MAEWRAVVDRAADNFRVQHPVLTANRSLHLGSSASTIASAERYEPLIEWIESELLEGADRIGYGDVKSRHDWQWAVDIDTKSGVLAELRPLEAEIRNIADRAGTIMAERVNPPHPASAADQLANDLTDFLAQEQRRRPVPKPARHRTDGKQDPLTDEALEALIRLDSEGGYWELDERSKRPRLQCRNNRLRVRVADFLIRNGYVAPAIEPVKMFAKAWLLADGKAAVARASIDR